MSSTVTAPSDHDEDMTSEDDNADDTSDTASAHSPAPIAPTESRLEDSKSLQISLRKISIITNNNIQQFMTQVSTFIQAQCQCLKICKVQFMAV